MSPKRYEPAIEICPKPPNLPADHPYTIWYRQKYDVRYRKACPITKELIDRLKFRFGRDILKNLAERGARYNVETDVFILPLKLR